MIIIIVMLIIIIIIIIIIIMLIIIIMSTNYEINVGAEVLGRLAHPRLLLQYNNKNNVGDS